jgi:hypothetical protein
MSGQAILYQFSRSKVERGDFSHFLGLYAPDELPDGKRLREMMNGFEYFELPFDAGPPAARRF